MPLLHVRLENEILTVPYLRGNLKTTNGLKSNLIPVTFLQRQLETREAL